MKLFVFLWLLFGTLNISADELKVIESYTPFAGSVLYTPNDGKPHPGVVVLHGSEGGSLPFFRLEAQRLASQGYAVLAFCYYNCMKDVILDPFSPLEDVNVNKTHEAFTWLKKSKFVQNKKTGIYGLSRGAEQALILAWKSAADHLLLPDAVAVHAPSDTVVGGFSWTGEDSRCWVCTEFDLTCFKNSKNPGDWDWQKTRWNPSCGKVPKNPYLEPIHAWKWNSEKLVHGFRIEIEKYKNPIFVTHGKEDSLWEYQRTLRIQKTLQRAGLKPEVHIFGGEGHNFKFPANNSRMELMLKFLRRTLVEN